ncbi:acid-resistance membrane protein [Moraxella lacunata]|uniref:Acid-resistance membrane protein n=1 Tax=Moraxella lacunata TaxID=477 RepID=A0A378T7Q2_MORLA|nr:DUF308 domain-containing protein [Moraxella lacunata]STZ56177.1 acid-resistance membrane protein [Moraxella lacunata]
MSSWIGWLIAGVISLIGGVFTLFNPIFASQLLMIATGVMFVISGLLTLLSALKNPKDGTQLMGLIVGLVVAILGLFLMYNPLASVVSLAVIIAILLIATGIGRIVWGIKSQGQTRFVLIIAGVLSLLLSVMIFADFPVSAVSVLGIFVGVEFIVNGVSLIVIALLSKKIGNALNPSKR